MTTAAEPTVQDTTFDHGAIDLGLDAPHSARVGDYLLGGRTNFTADRELLGQIMAVFPDVIGAAWEHEFFTHRAALYLAARGIWQFLDIGTGIPRVEKLHRLVQGIEASCRVVYLDNDPIVMQHLRALMADGRPGAVGFVHADLADPQGVLDAVAAEGTLDLSAPIALLLTAVLEHLPDERGPQQAVKTLTQALAPGSALVISHVAADLHAREMNKAAARCRQAGLPLYPRTRDQVEAYFDGWELADPGITTPARWHPISPGNDEIAACHVGVALGRTTGPARDRSPHEVTDQLAVHQYVDDRYQNQGERDDECFRTG
ncbi:MAG TPA: SAM-dependent methyltransferase [Actinospica sp.]|jgi:SAM-dependent methyltransferase|nr:SAM-dependent methyltransferase [Actinospica sp.]